VVIPNECISQSAIWGTGSPLFPIFSSPLLFILVRISPLPLRSIFTHSTFFFFSFSLLHAVPIKKISTPFSVSVFTFSSKFFCISQCKLRSRPVLEFLFRVNTGQYSFIHVSQSYVIILFSIFGLYWSPVTWRTSRYCTVWLVWLIMRVIVRCGDYACGFINTLQAGSHYAQVTAKITAFGQTFVLSLFRNR